jgi:hypothetical protein
MRRGAYLIAHWSLLLTFVALAMNAKTSPSGSAVDSVVFPAVLSMVLPLPIAVLMVLAYSCCRLGYQVRPMPTVMRRSPSAPSSSASIAWLCAPAMLTAMYVAATLCALCACCNITQPQGIDWDRCRLIPVMRVRTLRKATVGCSSRYHLSNLLCSCVELHSCLLLRDLLACCWQGRASRPLGVCRLFVQLVWHGGADPPTHDIRWPCQLGPQQNLGHWLRPCVSHMLRRSLH